MSKEKQLVISILKEKIEKLTGKKVIFEEYGNSGEFSLPLNHKAAMEVPKGGSMCANCKFLSKDKKNCGNKYYIKWNNGSPILPKPADQYCSDWYEPK
jgi:hypothetical protein